MTSRPLRWRGSLAIVLTGMTIVCDVAAMTTVPGYDPIRETISELAAGAGERFEDPGLYALAAALLLILVRFVRAGSLSRSAYAGLGFLLLMAAVVAAIAGWDAYDAPGGAMEKGSFALAAHKKMVWILGGAFFGAATFLAGEMGQTGGEKWRRASLVVAFLWLLTAPVFFFVPTSVDGLYERLLAVLVIVWIWLAALSARRSGAVV